MPKKNNRAALARDFFIELGYAPHQAAAIVGNLMQESGPGLDTGAVGDSGTAFGIAQWRGDRKSNLDAFAAKKKVDPSDFKTQLEFVDWELKNVETQAYKKLLASSDVNEATAAIIGYERPQGWSSDNPQGGHGWAARLENAMALMGVEGGAGGVLSDENAKNGKQASGNPMAARLSEMIAELTKPPSGMATLAKQDFSSLFPKPRLPPELPALPPIPGPVPLAQEEIQLPDYRYKPARETPTARSLALAGRRRSQYRGSA